MCFVFIWYVYTFYYKIRNANIFDFQIDIFVYVLVYQMIGKEKHVNINLPGTEFLQRAVKLHFSFLC